MRFSDGLKPKAGAACTIRSGRGIDARFRLGDSVRSLPPGLPWDLTVSSVQYEPPNRNEVRCQTRRGHPSRARLDSTVT